MLLATPFDKIIISINENIKTVKNSRIFFSHTSKIVLFKYFPFSGKSFLKWEIENGKEKP